MRKKSVVFILCLITLFFLSGEVLCKDLAAGDKVNNLVLDVLFINYQKTPILLNGREEGVKDGALYIVTLPKDSDSYPEDGAKVRCWGIITKEAMDNVFYLELTSFEVIEKGKVKEIYQVGDDAPVDDEYTSFIAHNKNLKIEYYVGERVENLILFDIYKDENNSNVIYGYDKVDGFPYKVIFEGGAYLPYKLGNTVQITGKFTSESAANLSVIRVYGKENVTWEEEDFVINIEKHKEASSKKITKRVFKSSKDEIFKSSSLINRIKGSIKENISKKTFYCVLLGVGGAILALWVIVFKNKKPF